VESVGSDQSDRFGHEERDWTRLHTGAIAVKSALCGDRHIKRTPP